MESQRTRSRLQLLVFVTWILATAEARSDVEDVLQQENDLDRYMQYCYSCSSDSTLCGDVVYDGHYLTSIPCKSTCFLRKEDNVTYRGCFDGWLGGMVRNDYLGCQTQIYFGKAVEWCFCSSPGSGQTEPCNGQSRDVMAQNAVSYGKLKSYASYAKTGSYATNGYAGDKAKSGYDLYQEEYPFINKEADRYQDEQGSLYSCKDKKDGTYSDPNDCNRYYLCSNGYPYHMRCPKGTQWNHVLRACAFSFHPLYPCKQTSYGYDVTSYPYGAQQAVNTQKGIELREEPKKKAKDMEEFYHYF